MTITRRRQPAKGRQKPFAWGRRTFTAEGRVIGVEYTLFRRDHRCAIHARRVIWRPHLTRSEFARVLRAACHDLRNLVDEIDLLAMEDAA